MPYWQAAAAVVGAGANYYSAQQQNQANAAINSKGRQWSNRQRIYSQRFAKYMSRNSVRNRMQDMRKAGINPILAAGFAGGGGGAPGAPGGPPQFGMQSEVTPDAINAAGNTAKVISEIGQIQAITGNIEQDTERLVEQTSLVFHQKQRAEWDTMAAEWNSYAAYYGKDQAKEQLDMMINEAQKARNQNQYTNTQFGEFMSMIRFIAESIGFKSSATFSSTQPR